ncbi:GAF domain-containing protein [Sphingomonas sp. CFBP 8760]|uniref:GAF domain-containing protein n=1 Tax=Sphingomonas sp. CFBP 8760 TaxID=2775282 RepID=UPI001781153B|nr:GAF domain-containing protein [Sphingomonas sp. CFBP 8760]MBD8548536.1 GAF domain-containing protein [Sphingomonas sp. CFBP 8760]
MGITIFTPAPLPENDRTRSLAAEQSGLLDRVNEPLLCDFTKEGRRVFNARWCGLILMIDQIQHVIASSNGLAGLYRRSTTLSSYVIYDPGTVFIVLNAVSDDRFAGNPFVDNGLIGFYAGAAVLDKAGLAIGALCVSDSTPRSSFSEYEAGLLCGFADRVTGMLT